MTLTEFLLARIAEDEDAALGLDRDAYIGGRWVDFGERYRVECEAKRRIVSDPETTTTRDTLRALAAAYADHPDYRDEWRP